MEILHTILTIAAGAAGYLLATFIFQPIIRFRSIRSQVLSDLAFYRNAINADGMDDVIQDRLRQRVESNRRHSADLAAIYHELPKFYQKHLCKKGVNIQSTRRNLMGLSNTYEYEEASRGIATIQSNLGAHVTE